MGSSGWPWTLESSESGRLNESLVKSLTGGDPIRARRMREDFWEFKPTHSLVLATNHKPTIRGTDTGIWRRVHLIPFSVKIGAEDVDKSFPEKLAPELPGILAWLVEGCLQWQRRGLDAPEAVLKATSAYRSEMDMIGAFLADCCDQIAEASVQSAVALRGIPRLV